MIAHAKASTGGAEKKGYSVHVVDSSISSDDKRWDKFSSIKAPDKVFKYGGMSNGIAQVVTDITSGCNYGEIGALYFHGHGAPGGMIVTGGKSAKDSVEGRSALTVKVISLPGVEKQLKKLLPYFTGGGMIVLRGCNTGQGDKGKLLVKKLASAVGVNVLASKWYQIVGRPYLVGDVIMAHPSGKVTDVASVGKEGLDRLLREDFGEWVILHLAEYFWDADD